MARGRQTITQRIALDGGKEIREELEALGLAGERAFKDLQSAANKLKGPPDSFSRALKKLGRDLDRTGRKMQALGLQARTLGRNLSLFITVPILALGAASVKTFSTFEQAMANVSTLVDTTVESMADMSDAVLDIARVVPVGLEDLTGALFDIRSAGESGADAMAILEGSARLAVAGLGTTRQAADLVTTALDVFALEGKEAAAVFDLIFKTTKFGKTTIDDMSKSFGANAGVVAAAGVEIEEFLAAVSALTSVGIKASVAYTQIRAAITGLTGETADAAKIFKVLEIDGFQALIKREGGLVAAFKAIRSVVGDNATAFQKAVGGAEGYNAVLTLTGGAAATFEQALADMESGVIAVDEAFRKASETASGSARLLQNNIQVASIAIGRELAPIVIDLTHAVIEILEAFNEWEPATKKLAIQALALTAALGPLVFVVGTLTSAIGTLLRGAGAFLKWLATGVPLAVKLRNALVILRLAFLALATNPFILAIAGAAALAIGLRTLARSYNNARSAAENHTEALEAVQAAVDAAIAGGAAEQAHARDVVDGHIAQAEAALVNAAARLTLVDALNQERLAMGLESLSFDADEREAGVSAAMTGVLARIEAATLRIQDFKNELARLDAGIKTTGDVAKAAGADIGKLETAADKVADALPKVTRAGKESAERIKAVSGELLKFPAPAAAAEDAAADLGETLEKAGKQAVEAKAALSEPIEIDTSVEPLKAAVGEVNTTLDETRLKIGDTFQAFVAGATLAVPAIEQTKAALADVADVDLSALDGIPEAAAQAARGVTAAFAGLAGTLRTVFSGVVAAITSELRSLESSVKAIISRLIAELRRLQAAIRAARAAASSSGGDSQGLARGGRVRGPGTSSSDSIPIWASAGEFMVRASAVKHYGADLFAALNSMRLSKDAIAGMRRMAQGGFVSPLAVPAMAGFAAGGDIAVPATGPSGRPITLMIGGEAFEGLFAPDDVADRLVRAISVKRIRSTGNSPVWRR